MRSRLTALLLAVPICLGATLIAADGVLSRAGAGPATAAAAPWGASSELLRAATPRARACVKHRNQRHRHARLCKSRHTGAQPTSPTGRPAIGIPPASGPSSGGPSVPANGSTGVPAPPTETPQVEPPSIPRVQVTAVEYGLSLSRTTVPAGKVIFEFIDGGQDEHNLNAASEEGETALAFATAKPKEVHDQKVELRRGSYLLFCSLPEHEAKGMKATLVVE